jgi:hypothetical protein
MFYISQIVQMRQLVGDYLLVQAVHVRNHVQDMMLVRIMCGMVIILLHAVHPILKELAEAQR